MHGISTYNDLQFNSQVPVLIHFHRKLRVKSCSKKKAESKKKVGLFLTCLGINGDR